MCPSGAMSFNSSPIHIQFLKVTLISHGRVVYYDTKDLRRGELGCTGLYWEVVGCGTVFLGVAGFYLDVLCFYWLCFAALGFTGLYWEVLVCTGLGWAVLLAWAVLLGCS